MRRGSSPERWREIDQLFAAALDHEEDTRDSFVRGEAGADVELAEEVLQLLHASAEAERVIGESAVAFARPLLVGREVPVDRDRELTTGDRIGPYEVIRELGRGGMGVVYLARRADREFEKDVALKVVKRGMDTDEILARFRLERQILARLEHDAIARLYDGGMTADGRPYLVMEQVDGLPLTDFCHRQQLDLSARLRLFIDVCRAVQAAHQQLVVHRDLKPSNILVTPEGRVKLLDFGLARLLAEGDGRAAPATSAGARILTPEYAAPEQILGGPVTTATDVYALGAVLYQLLTGCRPIEPTSSFRELVLRELLDREPVPASTVAGNASLRGDIDAILDRALKKEARHRYQSPGAFADDLTRYLQHQPVLARPTTRAYRLRRFLQRHRPQLAITAVLLAMVMAGVMIAGLRITRERDLARHEAAKAEATAAFLTNLFLDADTDATLGDTLTIGELLARGAARLDSLHAQPEVQASVQALIGGLYHRFGGMEQARPLLERALATRQRLGTDTTGEVPAALARLARLRWQQGDYAPADSLYRLAIEVTVEHHGARSPEAASLQSQRGFMRVYQGRYLEAHPLLSSAVPILRGAGPEWRPAFATAIYALATLDMHAGHRAEAERGFREALALNRADHGEVSTAASDVMIELGVLLGQEGRRAEADSLLTEGLSQRRRLLGPDHRFTATALNNLSILRRDMGDLRGADTLIREALAIHRRTGLVAHDDHARLLLTFGGVLWREHKADSAERVTRQALHQIEAREGPASAAADRARDQLRQIRQPAD